MEIIEAPRWIDSVAEAGTTVLHLRGAWRLQNLSAVTASIRAPHVAPDRPCVLDCSRLESLDTATGFMLLSHLGPAGLAFVKLKPWGERTAPELKAAAVAGRSMQALSKLRDASFFAFAPPAVSELGNASGFDLMLQDRANLGHAALTQARNQLLGMAAKERGLVGVRPDGQDDTPQLEIDIDEHKAGAQGVSLADIHANLAAAWGSSYVNDFIDKGRVKKVFLQADAPYRMLPQDLNRWSVKNANGDMVAFDTFATARWASGSPRLERYNGVPSMEILGMAMPGAMFGRELERPADDQRHGDRAGVHHQHVLEA
jgi:multidrug efflux pump subunit AcrB